MSHLTLVRRELSLALFLVILVLSPVSMRAQTPVITQQPPSSLTLTQGAMIDLTVEFTHPEPDRVCVEWLSDGIPILLPHCTNRLRLSNVDTRYSHLYQAILSYFSDIDLFSVTSNPCALRVLTAPVLADPGYSNQTFSFYFDTVRFSSTNVAPMTNVIEFTDALESTSGLGWIAATNAPADGNRFHFSVTNSPSTPPGQRRFYRVRVE